MNLATVYEEQGQLAKAEATYLQAIAQWREADRPGEQALASRTWQGPSTIWRACY